MLSQILVIKLGILTWYIFTTQKVETLILVLFLSSDPVSNLHWSRSKPSITFLASYSNSIFIIIHLINCSNILIYKMLKKKIWIFMEDKIFYKFYSKPPNNFRSIRPHIRILFCIFPIILHWFETQSK